ncbi:MAG TPA: 50S ribosomal protein L17 [Candidatus Paceibacterota bacterium]|nr:50S ribosomal protein L17 [Candidatus Paceibacterota bacterium]
MRRGNKRKFGRESAQRNAFFKALATGLIEHGRIRTTEARAKSLRPVAEKLVTRAKQGDLAARRILSAKLGPAAVTKLMGDIAPRFADRKGGYTRVVKLGRRTSDGAPMAVIEFVA